MRDHSALNAAVLLLGADQGHALIGCDWGRKVSLPDDREVCTSQARRRLILHGPAGEEYDLKACDQHADVLERETDPHEAEASRG